ncbi:hypothetical protein [Snuella sedimenti]|uniref:Uncharacterized protein n=1 Tax=Snuella sedimenti TaxID=2798802 RepID=A0A8J7J5X4_9FLAO|nr:hypothetical protein [Snuella sedimenti]MBJ6369428.1 hypothetical protein [Snuella sedimenti]
MKTLKTALLIAFAFCLTLNIANAQKRYYIHVDNVKPSMVKDYEKVAKEFVEACKKHKPQTEWLTSVTSDLRYMYVTPLEKFADLDAKPFADMSKAMGEDWTNMFTRFNKCYDSHSDYIITLAEDLTYMPEGFSQTQEGLNNREYYFLYYTPENQGKLKESMKAIKELFVNKNSKLYYRVYHSGLGNPESYYLVAVSSKDDVDAAMQSKANDELLGEKRHEVFGNMMKHLSRFEEYKGQIRPDLAYSSN